jgi:hypothetical protein
MRTCQPPAPMRIVRAGRRRMPVHRRNVVDGKRLAERRAGIVPRLGRPTTVCRVVGPGAVTDRMTRSRIGRRPSRARPGEGVRGEKPRRLAQRARSPALCGRQCRPAAPAMSLWRCSITEVQRSHKPPAQARHLPALPMPRKCCQKHGAFVTRRDRSIAGARLHSEAMVYQDDAAFATRKTGRDSRQLHH